MNRPLSFEPEVREEIDEAYAWYDGLRAGSGEDFLSELEAVLDRIQRNPELHAPIYLTVRHALVKRFPYAVYYRAEPDRVEVIAVHHTKRDPKRWRSRA